MSDVPWGTDLDAASTQARRARRLLLVQFLAAGRPLCQEMEARTLVAPAVARLVAEKFVAVKVDAEARKDLFARLVGGRGALAAVVLDDTADAVAALIGFGTADDYAQFLSRTLAGHAALVAARKALARTPRDAARALVLADGYEALGSQRRAEEVLTGVLALTKVRATAGAAITPGPAEAAAGTSAAAAHERLARIEVVRGRVQEARRHLESFARLDDGDRTGRRPRARLTEGLVLMLERRVGEARQLLDELLRQLPQLPERDHALLALGTAHHELKDDARALAILGELVAKFPTSRFAAAAAQHIEHIKNPVADHVH